jgi:outer membrane protein OmpA-like peptidoglycan-associated protein
MKQRLVLGAVSALVLSSCASTGEQSSMSPEQLSECLQPNRRVVVELNGRTLKPAPKPPAEPPKKPAYAPVAMKTYVQGSSAFDAGSAVLKPEGQKELDSLAAKLDKQKVEVSAVIVSGHTDRLEAEGGNKALSEQRAKAVTDYLTGKGVDKKLIFWEGKEAREPVAVTKFCS